MGGPAALDQPLYGATIAEAYGRFWKKYATFTGRASRSELWWVVLITFLLEIVFTGIGLAATGGDFAAVNASLTGVDDLLSYAYGLLTLLPSIAVTVRRLHDIDRSGSWFLIVLVPLVGFVLLIIWNACPPQPAGARYDRHRGRFLHQTYGGPVIRTWTAADIPDLHGLRAVVTGANSGLGYATSLELARPGATW